MESIGKQIGKLRQSAGITQEKLGQALGVTTQAVSRWECGGTPDASLLPAIADFFQVSIDELFGRKARKKGESLEKQITSAVASCSEERRFDRAFQLCRSIRSGLLEDVNQSLDVLGEEYGEKLGGVDVYSANMTDRGVAWSKLMESDHSFFLMPEPEKGFGSVLAEPEDYERLFALLGKPGCSAVLIYLYGNNHQKSPGFSAQWVSEGVGLPIEQTGGILEALTEADLMSCQKVRVSREEQIEIYSLKQSMDMSVLLLLLNARYCIHCPTAFAPLWDERSKPILAKSDWNGDANGAKTGTSGVLGRDPR